MDKVTLTTIPAWDAFIKNNFLVKDCVLDPASLSYKLSSHVYITITDVDSAIHEVLFTCGRRDPIVLGIFQDDKKYTEEELKKFERPYISQKRSKELFRKKYEELDQMLSA